MFALSHQNFPIPQIQQTVFKKIFIYYIYLLYILKWINGDWTLRSADTPTSCSLARWQMMQGQDTQTENDRQGFSKKKQLWEHDIGIRRLATDTLISSKTWHISSRRLLVATISYYLR